MLYIVVALLGTILTFYCIIGMYRYLDGPTQYGLEPENYIIIVMVSIICGMSLAVMVM